MWAVVDNLAKRREALPHLAGVYFVTPTEQSARLILEDWKVRVAHPGAGVQQLAWGGGVAARLGQGCSR